MKVSVSKLVKCGVHAKSISRRFDKLCTGSIGGRRKALAIFSAMSEKEKMEFLDSANKVAELFEQLVNESWESNIDMNVVPEKKGV